MRPLFARLLVAGAVVALISAALWAASGWTTDTPDFAASLAAAHPVATSEARDTEAALPDQVWTVTLYDDLHPEPEPEPEPVREAPPPKLNVRLIAIRSAGETRTAFIHDETGGDYLELALDDRLASGARVTGITEAAVTFTYGGRTITLELQQR